MSGLLAFLIVLMIILLVAVVVMMISIVNLTRHIRRSQENVEAVQRRVAKIDTLVSVMSAGTLAARLLLSENQFGKYFAKRRSYNARKKSQKTTK